MIVVVGEIVAIRKQELNTSQVFETFVFCSLSLVLFMRTSNLEKHHDLMKILEKLRFEILEELLRGLKKKIVY